MTLIQKLNKELEKVGLEFKTSKELATKFKGMLIDKKTNIEIPHEVVKILQWDKIRSYANWCRDYMDMAIKLNKMKEGK